MENYKEIIENPSERKPRDRPEAAAAINFLLISCVKIIIN